MSKPGPACLPFLCSREGFASNPLCKKIEECKYEPPCNYRIWMTDESSEAKHCCPDSLCGDYCRRLTPEQRKNDPKCYTPPEDECKYAFYVAKETVYGGRSEVALTPELLSQIKDSIKCYEDNYDEVITVTFACFMKGIDQGYQKLKDKAAMEEKMAQMRNSGATIIDNSEVK